MIRRTSSRLCPWRHWKIALCSLSTGIIFTPFLAALWRTIRPAITSASLLARAIALPASIASSVGIAGRPHRPWRKRPYPAAPPPLPDNPPVRRELPLQRPDPRSRRRPDACSSSITATRRGRKTVDLILQEADISPAARAVIDKFFRMRRRRHPAYLPLLNP